MGLNLAKGNMYEFVSHTWNTVKGFCSHDCSYCYMKRWGGFERVRFDEGELRTDLGADRCIFVGSSCDLFAESIPAEWITRTLEYCRRFDNKYLFQTKNPSRFLECPELASMNASLATTIESNRFYPEIMGRSPIPEKRAESMADLKGLARFVTVEPILKFDLEEMVDLVLRCEPLQVNIGADSGKNGLPEPTGEQVSALVEHLQPYTTVVCKKNLERVRV